MGFFEVDSSSGRITLATAFTTPDRETLRITVAADDGVNRLTRSTVEVAFDVIRNPIPAPVMVRATNPQRTTVDLWWATDLHVYTHRIEYRPTTSGPLLIDNGPTAASSYTLGNLACGTSYTVVIVAHGKSPTILVVGDFPTSPSPSAPSLVANPYSTLTSARATVLGSASQGQLLAIISATDPDGEALTYRIVSGDAYGQFTIDVNHGHLCVGGELRPGPTPC